MEKQIVIENPWYGMINSPEQAKRRQARMEQDAKVYRKQKAKGIAEDACLALAAVAAVVMGVWYQLGV